MSKPPILAGEYFGELISAGELAKRFNVKLSTIRGRIRRGVKDADLVGKALYPLRNGMTADERARLLPHLYYPNGRLRQQRRLKNPKRLLKMQEPEKPRNEGPTDLLLPRSPLQKTLGKT